MSKISNRHEEYQYNIRNPELAQCSSEIAELCRHYGVMDNEFEALIALVREELYSMSVAQSPLATFGTTRKACVV